MTTTQPKSHRVPDNDDISATPIQPNLLDAIATGLQDSNVQPKFGEEATALLNQVINEMRARQAVSDTLEADSDGIPEQAEGPEAGELSPEQLQTIATLKANFDAKEAQLQTAIKWPEVHAKLKKTPEKLVVLKRLIDRGGEPTLTAQLPNGKFRFDELSAESPAGHRGIDAVRAEEIAKELGAELTEPEVYATFRPKGIVLDKNTFSWLRTTNEVRRTGDAFIGYNGFSGKRYAGARAPYAGLRCSLEV